MDQATLAPMILQLRSCYPQLGKVNPDEYKAQVAAYWSGLRSYSDQVVARAFSRAVGRHPNYFPTLGQIQAIALEVYHDEQRRASRGQRELLPPSPLAESNNPVSALGAKWEEESERLGLDPRGQTPPEVFERRMAEFWEAWEQTPMREASDGE